MSVLERTSIEREREKRIKTNSSYWLGSPLNHGLETLFLCFTVLHKQTQEWRDLRSLQFKARTEPSACHVTGSLFTYPVYRMPGWLGWLYTTTLVGCGNPFTWGLHAEQRCALEWVHSWSWATAVFPPGQSRTSRQFLQTDFLIVLDNCTRGKGNAGDWEHFFPRKTLIQAHQLGINSSQDMEQSKDQD